MNPHRLRAYILLIIVSLIWAAAGPIIKYTLGVLPPLTFLTYRFAISTVFGLIAFIFIGFSLPKDKKSLALIAIYGLFTSTIALGLLFWGLEKTTVVDMSLISITGPIMITIAGVIFLKERVTKREKIGMSIALIGMVTTVIEPILGGDGISRLSGNILIILYLLGNTISIVLLKILLRQGIKPIILSSISFIIGFLTILPLTLIKYGAANIFQTLQEIPLPYHLAVFFLAILSGNIAYALSDKAQKTIEISEAALFSYLYPVLSIPIAVLWLKEKVSITFLFGAIIIAVGIFVAEFKRRSVAST
ncbi:hypothetical protein A2V55_00175 [Candidatus Woesebacteria bacterium RBG_19FT_COMBO_37_29]|nr:MAG: hypothetical protein A2V55_00175 [Candidatus Woesebacteria bacterium RBG_19FT_COMBO_37_29]